MGHSIVHVGQRWAWTHFLTPNPPTLFFFLLVNQKLTGKYLTELGYAYDMACNGVNCLDILQKQERQDYEYVTVSVV